MPAKTDHASMTALIGAAIEADPALQARVKRLVNWAIEQAEYTMQWGTPADKSILMRATVPAMMKALQRTEDDAASKQQREALERMYALLRGD